MIGTVRGGDVAATAPFGWDASHTRGRLESARMGDVADVAWHRGFEPTLLTPSAVWYAAIALS